MPAGVPGDPLGPQGATAQISNQPPGQPFASIVGCLQPGSEQPGGQPHTSPRFASSCFRTKIADGGYGANTGAYDAGPAETAVISFGDGKPDTFSPAEPGHTPEASLAQVGAVYGLAYSSGTNPAAPGGAARQPRLFAAAFTKMQTRYGPGGPGAIYTINRATGAVDLFAAVPRVVPGPSATLAHTGPGGTTISYAPGDGSRADFYNAIVEPAYSAAMGGIHKDGADEFTNGITLGGRAFAGAGKTGLGDIDLDPQERFLYAVNLNDNLIYRFDTWAANPQATLMALPANPLLYAPGACGRAPGDQRQFGVLVTQTHLYVGGVCTAETTQNRAVLAAGVSRYDLATAAWSGLFGFALAPFDTQREPTAAVDSRWYPWRNGIAGSFSGVHQTYPQPLLSDLAIDEAGNLLLGLRDRFGDMTSDQPYTPSTRAEGDLLRATPNGSGSWNPPAAADAESFADQSGLGLGQEPEAANGALAYLPGTHSGGYGGEIAAAYLDPYRSRSFGIGWWDSATGALQAAEELYDGSLSTGAHLFGKAAGLGDIEPLCGWRAIGDRLWRDANGNGLQETGEPSIDGARLQLLDAGGTTVLATVTTGSLAGANGSYRFYVNPHQPYQVRVDPAMFGPGQPLSGLSLTTVHAGDDTLDSDADVSGTIAIPAAGTGDVNLSFDVGVRTFANVLIAKSGPATVTAGDRLTYTLVYGSNGTADAVNSIITDTLPPGTAFVSASPPPSSVSGQTVTWNIGTLPVGATGTITLDVQTDAGLNNGHTLTNQAQITTTTPGDSPGDNTSSTSTLVQRADVYVVKQSQTAFPVLSGQPVSYLIDYGNHGLAAAANVTLNDTPPAQLSGVAWACSSGCAASGAGPIVLNLGTLPAGASGRIVVNAVAQTTLTQEAFVNTAVIGTSTSETDSGNNRSDAPGVVWTADVQVEKLAPAEARAGEPFIATLRYRNNGPAPAASVRLVDTLPTGVSLFDSQPLPASHTGQTIAWDLGNLASGAEGLVTLALQTDPATPDGVTVVNIAQMSTATPDRDPANNRSTAATIIRAAADLAIAKTGPATVRAGSLVSYTLTYRNDGLSLARAAAMTDTLPAGFGTPGSAPPGVLSGGTLTWSLGDLAPGASGMVVVTGTLTASGVTVTRTNRAEIASQTADPDSRNNQAAATTVVQAPDLVISKDDGRTQVQPGDVLTYTVTLRNTGLAPAYGVRLRETPPAGAVVTPGLWHNAGSGTWTLDIGTLATGATITRSFVLTLPRPFSVTTVINQVSVTDDGSAGSDPTPSDNQAEDIDTLISGRIGDRVWHDRNGDGVQDPDEVGLPNVVVQLLDPDTMAPIAETLTDAGGWYGFGGLRLERYTVQLAPETTLIGSYRGFRATTPARPTTTLDAARTVDLMLDFGLRPTSTTDVVLAELRARRATDGVLVTWRTLDELNTARFRVLRSAGTPDRSRAVVIGTVPSQGSRGGNYHLLDAGAPNDALFYWLVEEQFDGAGHVYGPFWPRTSTLAQPVYLPWVTVGVTR
jgi:uncharacterized repeat protein (TIGR01451 family)